MPSHATTQQKLIRRTLVRRLFWRLWLFAAFISLLTVALMQLPWPLALTLPLLLLASAPVAYWLGRRILQPIHSLFRALAGTVTSYRDHDYSFGIHWSYDDELRQLIDAHNALGQTLREQRLQLVQRELLLDTMVQNTPVAMALVGSNGHFVYANNSARQLLNQGHRLEGIALNDLLARSNEAFQEAFRQNGDGIFTVNIDDNEEIFLLSQRAFQLNGRPHTLILIRQLTAELRRQEVQTWKKVIRVISHELNNALAPIASLAHSGQELVRRQQYQRLDAIFETVAERARHLERFILGYAQFAKLPNPKKESIRWPAFITGLQQQSAFQLDGELPDSEASFDPAQLSQALLNLLKNAQESGSPDDEIKLSLQRQGNHWRIDIIDRGSGMSDTVLANALVPFYSTKRSGTGLGLALVREIIEAHNGKLSFANRDQGGLRVTIRLPV
ncbi:sensor histidine kinase [Permianibacter aggregans]|uniref:histidine kinase n=1 Tax=Permianibacter aggregans TaxID=1510150 RepID=A0A4R6UPQ7_9GAMM|nr:ATP-binding protein [Permianibacter aggregans]TDQ48176.1 histidine kinase/DNA gyrase B/HSP90-like ATPase [Permianibacter aggregans]